MQEMRFGVIIFCQLSAMAFFGAVLWLLTKTPGAVRRLPLSLPAAFLAASVTFSLVYVANRFSFSARPTATAACNAALLAALVFFPALKKKLRGVRPKKRKDHPLRLQAAALEHMLELDPLNAFCFEQLSELYEKMGEPARALEAAREAARLDPTADNKWRVEELEKKSPEKGKARP